MIDNEDMTAGLMGVDADKNGIRDDIDRLIALRYALTPAMKRASEQKARALQQSMQATTKAQSILAGNEIMRAGDCALKIFPRMTEQDSKFRQTMSKEISALTANTKERFTAYWKSESLGSGVVYRQPEEPVCD